MSLLGTVREPHFGAESSSPAPDDDYWYQTQQGAGIAQSGALVTPDMAMRVSAVFACVRVIAESFAMLPIVIYRDADGRGNPAKDHPLSRVFRRPNQWQTWYEFATMLSAHKALRGNGYARIVLTPGGDIDSLIPLHTDRVRVLRLTSGRLVYDVRDPFTGTTTRYTQDEIFHLRGLSTDGIVGMSTIATARETIGGALGAQDYANRLFANDAKPAGILSIPGKLSEAAAKRLKEQWQLNFTGQNVHKTAVVEQGAKYERISLSNEDLQFLETRKFQVSDIARIFRVPPHMIGDLERSTNNNIEHQGIEFLNYTLMPELVAWEQAIERDLMLEAEADEYSIAFDDEALMRGDLKSRYDAYAVGRQWGFLSANDIRKRERMQPIDGGDTYLVPVNMTTADAIEDAEDAREATEPAEPAEPTEQEDQGE